MTGIEIRDDASVNPLQGKWKLVGLKVTGAVSIIAKAFHRRRIGPVVPVGGEGSNPVVVCAC